VRDRLDGQGNLKFLGTGSLRDILGTCRGCLCYRANKLNEEKEEKEEEEEDIELPFRPPVTLEMASSKFEPVSK
jgi:hypothetical protein